MVERLVDPRLGTLELSKDNGYVVTEMDLGFPEARDVVDDRVNADGTEDRTTYHGARSVALKVAVDDAPGVTRRDALARLRAFAAPGRRPVLYFNDEDFESEPDRMIQLRGDQLGAPFNSPFHLDTQVQWVAPDGVIEAVALSVVDIPAAATNEEGITFPVVFPVAFPVSAAIGAANVEAGGTTDAWPIIRLYGPCTDPRIENTTAGWALEFAGLTVAAGDYLELDTRERTVMLNGSQSRYADLDFVASQWGPLVPGVNEIRYYPASFSGAALAQLRWRDTWI